MVIKRRKIQKCICDYALKLISGLITIEELLDYFEKNPQAFNCFNTYACKHLYTTLRNISALKEELNNFNIRIYIYQLFQGYLFSKKIKYIIKAPELLFFYSMQEQCPEWFQSDYNTLSNIFPNIEELVKNKTLYDEIVKICQVEKEYPVWLQNPEWPIIDGGVCVFESQTTKPDDMDYSENSIEYTFKNPKTNEKIKIIQYD